MGSQIDKSLELSIIVPTKDNPNELRVTIDSISSSAPPGSEIIIVDSSNPPTISEEIKTMVDSKFIIRCVHTEPRGIFEAVNYGIKLARGNWIIILTAGDGFVTDAMRLLKTLRATTENIIVFSQHVYDRQYKHIYNYIPTLTSVWPHQSVVVRSNVYREYGLYDANFRVSADAQYFAKIRKLTSYKISHEALSFFCLGGISSKFSIRNSIELFILHREMGRSAFHCFFRSFVSPLLRAILVTSFGHKKTSFIKKALYSYYRN